MSQNEMVAKIEELNELEILMDGLKAQADAIRDDIKSEMAAQGTEELNLGKYMHKTILKRRNKRLNHLNWNGRTFGSSLRILRHKNK